MELQDTLNQQGSVGPSRATAKSFPIIVEKTCPYGHSVTFVTFRTQKVGFLATGIPLLNCYSSPIGRTPERESKKAGGAFAWGGVSDRQDKENAHGSL
jgi:hypothetical protein